MKDSTTIELKVERGVATLTLNRPEKRNAFTDEMRSALIDTLDAVSCDDSIRALVVTGAGKGFCAGGDIDGMERRMQAPAGNVAFAGWSRQQRVHQAVTLLYAMAKPTIAAVNGAAAGLGADMALSCDFVVASREASFTWSYIKRGLIPDGGGLYLLPRRVGLPRAKELIFSGRRVDIDEAATLGIVDRISTQDSLLDDARTWAEQLAEGSPVALALGKTLLNRSFESDAHEILMQGSQAQAVCYTSREHRGSVQAFLDARESKKGVVA